jgi:hypothetical protein
MNSGKVSRKNLQLSKKEKKLLKQISAQLAKIKQLEKEIEEQSND